MGSIHPQDTSRRMQYIHTGKLDQRVLGEQLVEQTCAPPGMLKTIGKSHQSQLISQIFAINSTLGCQTFHVYSQSWLANPLQDGPLLLIVGSMEFSMGRPFLMARFLIDG